MARRTGSVGNLKSKPKVEPDFSEKSLDYHEGLSINQVRVILHEFGFKQGDFVKFSKWMYGQTCPVLECHSAIAGANIKAAGVYEYDLFRWISNQRRGTPLIFD